VIDVAKEIGEALAKGAPNAGRRAAAFIGSESDPRRAMRAVLKHVPQESTKSVLDSIRTGFEEVVQLQRSVWNTLVRGIDREVES
jgi:hypothetical protein